MNNNKTIEECSKDRKNNYDFIRFVAAILVIISHAYPLTSHNNEILVVLSNGQWSLGAMAVAIFFIISGFLIVQSFDRNPNLFKFIKARVLRIYPGLIVAVFFCAFIVGPLVTTLSIKEYFSDSNTYNYLKTILLFPMYWTLPGVFESSSFNNSVNGSLWTLPFELLCYSTVAFFGVLGLLKFRKLMLFVFISSMYIKSFLMIYIPTGFTWVYLPSFFELLPFFLAGVVFYLYRDKIILNHWYALFSFILLCISAKFGGLVNNFALFGSYLIMYLAYSKFIKLQNFSKYGDFSYGIYIYAFPIQQSITYFFNGEISVLLNIAFSIPLTIILAVLSWHLIEKPVLKLKNRSIFQIR